MAGSRPGKMTEQQRLFVQHYLRHRNASRAAREAGYSVDNARHQGWRFMNDPTYEHVANAIRQALSDQRTRWEALNETIIQQLAAIGMADMAEAYDEDGELLPLHQMAPETRAAIAELKETEFLGQDGTPAKSRKVRHWSKPEALVALAKITGLAKDRIEHSGALDIRGAREELASILSRMGPPEGEPGGEGSQESRVEGPAPSQPD